MRVAIGSDHAGFPLKETVITRVEALGHTAVDLGAHEYDANDDYPDFAFAVAQAVTEGRADRGVILWRERRGSEHRRQQGSRARAPPFAMTRTRRARAWSMTI